MSTELSIDFAVAFEQLTGLAPHAWQVALANGTSIDNRLVHIPTGFGKTLGVASVWAFHRRQNHGWPRRLVWCLPSRVLVEQTVDSLRQLFEKVGQIEGTDSVPVYPLLGGVDTGDWHRYPERPCVLVGTQEMLLSRALNRGYGSGRARWPIEFGLLNQDCLWVMDEVQLQGVGLATSAQLQAFRELWSVESGCRCTTWWMSATLAPDWLKTKDFAESVPALCEHAIDLPEEDRQGELWQANKPCSLEVIAGKPEKAKKPWAELILQRHNAQDGSSRMTLVIVNRVASAVEIHDALSKLLAKQDDAPALRLVHSRFRGRERETWGKTFLSRQATTAEGVNQIIVATQVVEAGVDISATTLITELAPWGSLVQRFGRAARYGGKANIVVVDPQLKAKDTLPYEEQDLLAAAEAISQADDVSLARLFDHEHALKQNSLELYQRLYRFEYRHLLSRRDCEELFDTTADLSGADLDIGRFIREEANRDISVCWAVVDWNEREDKLPSPQLQPRREAICPVPIAEARDWLITQKKKHAQWSNRSHAWCWDYVEGAWKRLVSERQLLPGSVVLVDVQYGGYDSQRGFTGGKPGKSNAIDVDNVFEKPQQAVDDLADQGQSREDRSRTNLPQTIATHGWRVSQKVEAIANRLNLSDSLKSLLMMAARWHDWGKAHGAFQANICREENESDCWELAKASKWVHYRDKHFNWPEMLNWPGPPMGKRRGFRHELATTLGMLELLARDQPDHDALLGPFAELIELGEIDRCSREPQPENHPLVAELRGLSAEDFHLLLYLICSHHGKVRGAWQSTPLDQEFPFDNTSLAGEGMPVCGIRDKDPLSGVQLYGADGECHVLPPVELHLDAAQLGINARYGASWTERVQQVRQAWGIFTLAWLEAIFRAADGRASQDSAETEPDPLLATMQETN